MMMKVTVNGQMYLGKISENEGVVILTDSMPIKQVDRETISEYLKRKNLQSLETEEFSGMGTAVSKKTLTDEEKLIKSICERAMKYAMKKAKGGMVNSLFDETLGKF